MADEGRRVTMDELLILFKDVKRNRRAWPHHPSFRRASLRSPSSKRGGAAKKIPALLTTKLLLLCSPRDSGKNTEAATGSWCPSLLISSLLQSAVRLSTF